MDNGRIAIPSEGKGGLEGLRSGHFGHCQVFTLVDVKEGQITHVETLPNAEHREGGCMVPVNLLADNAVNAIIVGGMGIRPLMGFNQKGIDVYYDINHREIKPAVEELLAGNLQVMTTENVCGGGNH